MQVAIRVDASTRIGLGHVIRCRTLAGALAQHGAEVCFIARRHDGNGIGLLREAGFSVHELPAPLTKPSSDTDYAGWLGVPMDDDAEQTKAMLPPGLDWLIVDHYGIDAQWESTLRPYARHLFVIDDIANRPHDCDVLLDQNYARDGAERYEGLLPAGCQRLLGPRYAMLHSAFHEHRVGLDSYSEPRAPVARIFVFFGGSDPDNLTGRALEALCEPDLMGIPVDCVLGANNPHQSALADLAQRRGGVELHRPQPHLADLMARADLAIGAGGTTTWERCALGLPTVVVSIAENQRSACERLSQDGYIDYLGHHDSVDSFGIARAVRALNEQPTLRHRLGRASAELVDARGTERVVESMVAITENSAVPCH